MATTILLFLLTGKATKVSFDEWFGCELLLLRSFSVEELVPLIILVAFSIIFLILPPNNCFLSGFEDDHDVIVGRVSIADGVVGVVGVYFSAN